MKLLCPICKSPLVRKDRSAVCANRHSFDYAASGYLNLLRKEGASHGDDAAMVKARTSFLASGAYRFLQNRLAELTDQLKPTCLVDLGCGEGYYTSALNAPEKYGFDLAKTAVKHAAKNDPSTRYVLSSIFRLPLPDGCAQEAVTCFAPVAEAEILRLLEPGGHFILVTPGPVHLFELKQKLYETPYLNAVKEMVEHMEKVHDETIQETFTADQQILQDLFLMTPYAWRTGERGKAVLKTLDELTLTAQFQIRIYRKPQDA